MANATSPTSLVTSEEDVNVPKPLVDTGGHGTHIASIAARKFVKNAMVVGKFNYMAFGMAPRAHLVIYKTFRFHSDNLNSYDKVMITRVNIINYSIGDDPFNDFYDDDAPFSGYKATNKDIFVSVSVGNREKLKSRSHSAPWLCLVNNPDVER